MSNHNDNPFTDPICNMKVNPDTAKYIYEYNGEKWYFCSEHCLKKFKDSPEQFIKDESGQPQTDPICHMTVDPDTCKNVYEYQGRKWYFCSEHCMQKFKDNPESYIHSTR